MAHYCNPPTPIFFLVIQQCLFGSLGSEYEVGPTLKIVSLPHVFGNESSCVLIGGNIILLEQLMILGAFLSHLVIDIPRGLFSIHQVVVVVREKFPGKG